MTVTDLCPPAPRGRVPIPTRRTLRPAGRRRALPGVERLEGLLLLSGTAHLPLKVAAAVAPQSLTAAQTVSISSSGQAYPLTQPLPGVRQFDPALGTLTSVVLSVDGSITTSGQVANPNTQVTTATLQAVGSVTLNGSLVGGTPLTDSFPAASATSPPLASNASYNFPPVVAAGSATVTITDPGILGAYTGTGSVSPATAITQALTITSSDNGAGLTSQVSTSNAASVTVTYNYTPPLPPPPPLPGTLSGFIYNDLNDSGLRDSGEPGFGNQTLVVSGTTALGQPLAPETTVTDANGFYRFGDLPAGTYTVTETTQPAGFLRNKDSRNGVILPVGPTDVIPGIAVTAGNTAPNNDFGKLAPGDLSGFVYGDRNTNGLKDAGEPGFTSVVLALTGTNDLGQSVARETTVTGTGGAYSFGGLRPGTYTVTETTVPSGFLPLKNSRNGVVLPIDLHHDAVPAIGVTAGNTSPNNDFGLIHDNSNDTGVSSLSGYVFDDNKDNNGIKEPGELGLGNVTVTLTGTDARGHHVSMSTSTNSSGLYQFPGLVAGTYTLDEGASPANFHHGKTSRDNVAIPGSAGTHLISNVTLADQQILLNNDFGELRNIIPQTPCGPLFITNIQRFGVHNEPTEIVLTFNEQVAPGTALNPANYHLVDTANFIPRGPAATYRAIVYNAGAHTVTLITNAQVNVHHQYLLTVGGLTDVCGTDTLQGTTGVAGTPYKVTVNRSTLAGFLTNQGVFIPVDHGQFAPGTFGLVPPVGSGSAAALAGYPVPLSSLPAGSNGATSEVLIPATTATTALAHTRVAAQVQAPKPKAATVTVAAHTPTAPRPFSLHR